MRSGNINHGKDPDRRAVRFTGNAGYMWSSGAVDDSVATSAYRLLFSSASSPSDGPELRRYAYTLRCLSTTAVGKARTYPKFPARLRHDLIDALLFMLSNIAR